MRLTNYYPKKIEEAMKKHYDTLTEKDKRQYASVEAMKLGHGGQSYIASIFDCDRKTIYNGINEEVKINNRIRKKGGGRRKIITKIPQIDEKFLNILENYTAGNPMNNSVIWTDLSDSRVCELLEKDGIKVSIYVVQQLFKKHGFKQRKMKKTVTMKESENRDEQFENIAVLKEEYIKSSNNPVISLDVKKKR